MSAEDPFDDITSDIGGPDGNDPFSDITADISSPVKEHPLKSALKRIYAANPVAGEKALRGLVSTPEGRQKIAPFIPAGAATIGTVLAPGVGTVAGAATGSALRQMIDIEGGARPTPLEAGLETAGETLLGGFPESSTAISAAKNMAQSQGIRNLGFTKRFLSKSPRQLVEARKTAQTMLDEGVIRPFSGTEATLERALGAGRKSGKVIGKTIDDLEASGQMAVRPKGLVDDIESQLGPKVGGEKKMIFKEVKGQKEPLLTEVTTPSGAYGKTRKIVNEAKDTVQAHGGVGYNSPEEIGFKSLQKLKEKLAEIGKFVPGVTDERQLVFQRATGIARKAQDEAVKRAATPEVASKYGAAKKVYGDTEKAVAGLTNRLSSEAGNLQMGLLDTVLASGGLASGNMGPVSALLGGKKILDKFGSGTISSIADSLAKSNLPRSAANAIFESILGYGLQDDRK